MQDHSYLTAIGRTKLSAPVQYLHDNGLLKGYILDYGCGRGTDVKFLEMLGYACDKYDPHYQPYLSKHFQYDTVLCTFVLNVIEDVLERNRVMADIIKHCKGDAYVTVRNDVKRLNGITSRKTWQGLITLNYPIVKQTSGYTIYKLR